MTTEDILQLMPDEKLPELQQLFEKDCPRTSHVYSLIGLCMQWRKSAPAENNVLVYCPNGDFSDGTFVAIMEVMFLVKIWYSMLLKKEYLVGYLYIHITKIVW